MKRKTAVVATQSAQPFVPSAFKTRQFRLRMLTVNDVVKDYDAVMTSVEHLRGVFGTQSAWPADDLTHEQDLIVIAFDSNKTKGKTNE